MKSILLPWVEKMPWKMQSILLSGLRAPDFKTDATKRICRWMRSISQYNADPNKGYMEPQNMDHMVIGHCMDELEYLPCHYVHHFADALRVISLFGPPESRSFSTMCHAEIAVEIFHFLPETDEQFIYRHRDMVSHA